MLNLLLFFRSTIRDGGDFKAGLKLKAFSMNKLSSPANGKPPFKSTSQRHYDLFTLTAFCYRKAVLIFQQLLWALRKNPE